MQQQTAHAIRFIIAAIPNNVGADVYKGRRIACVDLLECHATRNRLHGDLGLGLGAVGAAVAHRWEPPLRGGGPTQRVTMDHVQKSQTTTRIAQGSAFAHRWKRTANQHPSNHMLSKVPLK